MYSHYSLDLFITKLHSSRMRTARSSSRQPAGGGGRGGSLPQCMLGYTNPPGVGLETPLSAGLETPLPDVGLETPQVWAWRHPHMGLETPSGCGPGDAPCHTPQAPPWVWAWKPARHAGICPSPKRPARHAGISPPLNRMTDRQV